MNLKKLREDLVELNIVFEKSKWKTEEMIQHIEEYQKCQEYKKEFKDFVKQKQNLDKVKTLLHDMIGGME